MKVGLYARVSTKDQSCELQLRDLRSYCAARHFVIAREYIDLGVSGTKDSRPQLNELMDDARKRKLDAVLCWRFDRFARSSRHLLIALEEFRTLGVQFVSFQENLDTSSPLGQAIFTIISAVAQLERDLICERVSAGIRNARANGTRLGRPSRHVDLDRIVEMQASGVSLRRIAATLNVGYGTIRDRLQSNERKTLDSRSLRIACGKPLKTRLFRAFSDGVFRSLNCSVSRTSILTEGRSARNAIHAGLVSPTRMSATSERSARTVST